MIEHIQRIGRYYQKNNPSITPVMGMVTKINSKDIKNLLLIDVQKDSLTYHLKDYREDAVNDALFYQSGNAMLGGGIRLDYYEDRKAKTPSTKYEKGRKKLKTICRFCEVEDRYLEIEMLVEGFLNKNNEKTFAMLLIDGRMPHEVFTDKFLREMYENTYRQLKNPGQCHICGQRGKVFNNILYSFYTNDKEIYKNIDKKELNGYSVDENCLNHIILAKGYIDRYFSTYWGAIGENVMFLPHDYNEDTAFIFENVILQDEGQSLHFIDNIRLNEEDFMDSVGKAKSFIDIIFYETQSSAFYINYHIQSILPSRFTLMGNLLKKYSLFLRIILKYAATLYISLDSLESTKKEKIRLIDAIFSGKRVERNVFFKRVTEVFRFYYLQGDHKKYRCIDTINRIYNFLCQCGCLEGEWNVLKKDYQDYQEFFQVNKGYFNLNEKKAWFILGMTYNSTIYYMRDRGDQKEGELDRTSLEKNFFFARKFDFKDFIYFSNLIEDKLIKYRIDKIFLKKMLCEAKELMANRESQLPYDEAKYIFFWGLDSYFGKRFSEEKQIEDDIKEEVL